MNNNEWLLLFIIAIEFAIQIGASVSIIGFLKDIYKRMRK